MFPPEKKLKVYRYFERFALVSNRKVYKITDFKHGIYVPRLPILLEGTLLLRQIMYFLLCLLTCPVLLCSALLASLLDKNVQLKLIIPVMFFHIFQIFGY